MRCLVIEDEADTARYICNGLTEDGFDTIWCRNGTDGLRLATGESWDVVVLDRMLPGDVEGLTIVETMRGQGKTTPIIVLSALANLDERVKGLRSGGDDYLTKPFGMTELVARIHALLRRAAPATDAPELCVGDLRLDLRRRRRACRTADHAAAARWTECAMFRTQSRTICGRRSAGFAVSWTKPCRRRHPHRSWPTGRAPRLPVSTN